MTPNINTATNTFNNLQLSNTILSNGTDTCENILIVDDDKFIREFFSTCLSPEYNCTEASSVEEALEILEYRVFSVVITDFEMPGLSCKVLLRQIARDFPDTSVIMATGVEDPEIEIEDLSIGVFDFLSKPCKPEKLEATVSRALKQRNQKIKARHLKINLELKSLEINKQKAELEKLQAQLMRSKKMNLLGQMTAMIANELSNSLENIFANLMSLENFSRDIRERVKYYDAFENSEENILKAEMFEKVNCGEMVKNILEVISDFSGDTQRVTELIQSLRVFSTLDEPNVVKTNINNEIDSTIDLFKTFFNKENIKLKLDYGKIPPVDAYSNYLNQVWINLLSNSLQSINETGGEITITTENTVDYVVVTISDTGKGIEPEQALHISEPGFSTQSIGQGNGFGLLVAKSIVEEHYGLINIESEIGKGTTCVVQLPIKNVFYGKIR